MPAAASFEGDHRLQVPFCAVEPRKPRKRGPQKSKLVADLCRSAGAIDAGERGRVNGWALRQLLHYSGLQPCSEYEDLSGQLLFMEQGISLRKKPRGKAITHFF